MPGEEYGEFQSEIERIETLTINKKSTAADATDAEGNTWLMRAIKANNEAATEKFKTFGATLDAQNHRGETALMLACSVNNPTLVKWLIEQGVTGILTKNHNHQTALDIAMGQQSVEIIIPLLNKQSDDEQPEKFLNTIIYLAQQQELPVEAVTTWCKSHVSIFNTVLTNTPPEQLKTVVQPVLTNELPTEDHDDISAEGTDIKQAIKNYLLTRLDEKKLYHGTDYSLFRSENARSKGAKLLAADALLTLLNNAEHTVDEIETLKTAHPALTNGRLGRLVDDCIYALKESPAQSRR